LNIVSVCRSLPSPGDPSGGIFVLNRLVAMADGANVRAIQPVPYFPVIKPLPDWARRQERRMVGGLGIDHAPMLYFPGMAKALDAGLLARSIRAMIVRMHHEQPIDLIDAHFGYPDGVGCVDVAVRLGIPVFITIRGFEKEFVGRPLIGRRMLSAFESATGIVAVSHSLQEFAVRNGVPASKIRVIHNAIDTSIFSFGERSEARARLGVEQQVKLVVSVGHLVPRKRHHVLLEAFARVRDRWPTGQLVIIGARAGGDDYATELRAMVDRLALQGSVRFAGNLPPGEVAAWLRAADVFALATAREGCCNAVLEALAVGTPVVTTDVGDNARFVTDEVNGTLVPVDDPTALAVAIQSCLDGREWDRESIARHLQDQVGNWNDVATRVLDFFHSSVEG